MADAGPSDGLRQPTARSRAPARLEGIFVGQPRRVLHDGEEVLTSIFKAPVAGPVWIRRHNLEGDRQSDRRVHGGEHKAVYAYAAEHYEWWGETLGRELPPGSFGENLVWRGLDEAAVAIGDVLRVGEAELAATGPRLPCFKLGLRFGDARIVKAFAQGGRWGVYFRVVKEGRIVVGDPVELVRHHPARVPVYDLARVYLFDRDDRPAIRRLLEVEELDPAWREGLVRRLAAANGPKRPSPTG